MQIEEMFKNELSIDIKEIRYLKTPKTPYFIYNNKIEKRGSDYLNNIMENNITIERYSKTKNKDDLTEIEKVNNWLDEKGYEYEVQTEWLSAEELYGTYWILNPILEKVRKEDN